MNRRLMRLQLPEPTQHVNSVERSVRQLHAPGKGVPCPPRFDLAEKPAGQIAAQSTGDVQRHYSRVVIGSIEHLIRLVDPEVVGASAVEVEEGHFGWMSQV